MDQKGRTGIHAELIFIHTLTSRVPEAPQSSILVLCIMHDKRIQVTTRIKRANVQLKCVHMCCNMASVVRQIGVSR